MLIDDASMDGYNYKAVAKKFDTTYYRHTKRIGAAESRNEGVNLCDTEYFLLLDAHIKQYTLNYGAYIDFSDLSAKWNQIDFYPQKKECIIPCVLGASYASSKLYWN